METASLTELKEAPRNAPVPFTSSLWTPGVLSWQYPSARRAVTFSVEVDEIQQVTVTQVTDDQDLAW